MWGIHFLYHNCSLPHGIVVLAGSPVDLASPEFIHPPEVLPGAGEGGPSSSQMAAVVALLQGGKHVL